MAPLRDPLGRVGGQIDRDLLREEEDAAGVPVRFHIEGAGLLIEELEQVQRGEVTRRVVEEDELAARVGREDPVRRLAGVPLVDRVVELQPRIGALPGRLGHLHPQLARVEAIDHLARGALGRLPGAVLVDGRHETVLDAHRVVRVLPGDRAVRVAVEVSRIAGGDQRLDLLLLARLPLHEVADLGMIRVDNDHLGRSPGDAARLGRARGAVEHLEEAHQPAGGAAARQPLHLAA